MTTRLKNIENDVIEIPVINTVQSALRDFSQTLTNHPEGLREQVQAGNVINHG